MAWTDRNVGVIEAFRDHLDDKLNERFGYGEILLQIEGIALLKDVFDLSSERGRTARIQPIPEYLYNALQFFFTKDD